MATSENNIVQVKNLKKIYPDVKAVDGISFEVHQGEIFGLLGPNGAGKTTTIECIEGLRCPDGGEVQVLGLDPQKDGYELRERIGIQFQTAELPDKIKVWEALDLFSAFYEHSVNWEPLLEQVGLSGKKNAFFNKLSGGQKQRVFIALALVNDPDLVFLDELTTGLDPQSRRAIWDLVLDIRGKGKTVFLTTHFMEEAERLCDRLAIIDHGKLVALDTPRNLIDSLGAENRVVFEVSTRINLDALSRLKGVKRVETIGEQVIVYGQKNGLTSSVVNLLDAENILYNNLRVERPTLEDVFLSLTGKEIRN